MYKKYIIIFSSVFLLFSFLFATGCKKKEDKQEDRKVVSKSIATEKQIKQGSGKTDKKKDNYIKTKGLLKPAVSEKKALSEQKTDIAAIYSGMKHELKPGEFKPVKKYNPEGKIDPFQPIFKVKEEPENIFRKKEELIRRIPKTPLEKIALTQLKLVAVIRTSNGVSKAVVEEESRKGYIVTSGTYIGKRSGIISEILKDRIIIEEKVRNVLGKIVVKKKELKLQKPPGE